MTGSDSDRPITFALGTPQRGHTIPEVDRFAIMGLLTSLDYATLQIGARTVQIAQIRLPTASHRAQLKYSAPKHTHEVDRGHADLRGNRHRDGGSAN
jgi:hypothetical protein